MEDLLTPEDVAKRLNVSEYTVRRLLRTGELQGLKVGGQWRITPSAVKDYIDKQAKQDKK
jgi:excisionase family DNA binding protein